MKQIKGVLSSLTIDGDELTVSKLTKVTFLKSDITSIDFQEASMAANGYIKFKLSNGNTPSVNFNVFQQTDFSKLLSELKEESKPQNSNEYDYESGLNESLYNLAKDIVNEYGSNKKGFGIGKAIVGACISNNPIGLVAGNIGAKKVRITCMNCGHEFWAGKVK